MPSLEDEIRRLIAAGGPMPISEYFGLCLTHPDYGYYTSRNPLGREGDFTTAPEISQMFGELIGVWTAAVWRQMGSPEKLALVELGPGRGSMMLDMLRAAQIVPGFRAALAVHLVEVSTVLEQIQRQTFSGLDIPFSWHRSVDGIPSGPAIVVANEFFDALPVHQAVKREDGWHERQVGIGADGRLAFTLAPGTLPRFSETVPKSVRDAPAGSVYEWRDENSIFDLARRLAHAGGAALVIDYGHLASGIGDTLQAIAAHRYSDPLMSPGDADLTAHVDFEALARAAESMGARVQGPIAQREFLSNLGIAVRAEALKARATEEQAVTIDSALHRLTDPGPEGMGNLFKAVALRHPGLGPLPGFTNESLAR